jgi:diguanylate cyclase (GGDEF)-like protein
MLATLALIEPGRLSVALADPAASLPLLAGFVTGAATVAVLALVLFEIRVRSLVRGAERIATGELGIKVAVPGSGLERRLGVSINAISSALAETYDRATVDRLTGVANRQSVITALWNEVERAGRYGRAISVAFLDIDHFKNVNDTYGHAAGDIVLRGVAQAIKANLRASDLVGRYGGEEFMLVLAETNVEEASVLAEKLRAIVEKLEFEVEGNPNLSVTISIGIAGGSGQAVRFETLVRDADGAMYSAKSLGRNQTYIFAEPSDDARLPRAPLTPSGRLLAQELGRVAREAAQAALVSAVAPLPEHSGRPSPLIAAIVVRMAGRLDLPDTEIERLRVAALLHDIGKVAVPTEILDKPTPLTSGEWRTVVEHARIGQVILEQASLLRDAAPIILHHHERFSGNGYPFGLRGTDIPLGARLIAIAEAYEAMINDRPYKSSISHDQAVHEIERHAGTQFDPALVELFVELYRDAAPTPNESVHERVRPHSAVDQLVAWNRIAKRSAQVPKSAPGRAGHRAGEAESDKPASQQDSAAG